MSVFTALILFNRSFDLVVQSLSRVRLLETPWAVSTPGFPVLHDLPEFTQIHAQEVLMTALSESFILYLTN